jgi:hypothetical protein
MHDALPARVKMAPPKKLPKPKFADAVAPEQGKRLSAVAGERSLFDALLSEFEAVYKAAELKAIAECYVGFGVDKKKKDDIIKVMRNWQRECELSDSSHAAQSKVGV